MNALNIETTEDLDSLSSLSDLDLDDSLEKEELTEETVEEENELLASIKEVDASDELAELDALFEEAFEESDADDGVSDSDLMAAIEEVAASDELAELYDQQAEESAPLPDKKEESVEIAAPEIATDEIEAPAPKDDVKKSTPPSVKIANRLGVFDFVDLTLLTPTCGGLPEDERLETFNTTIDGLAKKVGEKAVNFFTYLKTGGGLNEVTARAIKVMKRDGQLVGGDEGNLVKELLTKPYSLKTARSQGSQMLQLFTALKIGVRTSRGTLVLNEESIIWERLEALMK
ncbi:MAG: hypothetical protein IBX56_20055 [Methylomicrobium sp.]|nr:hypothetical protein [Methylomicrobium sp.]